MALMSLAIALTAVAEPITESQAQSIAAQFLAGQNARPTTLRRAATATAATLGDHAAYYIFNAGGLNDGYVIIAGDDQALPVLGYSDTGSFDGDNVRLHDPALNHVEEKDLKSVTFVEQCGGIGRVLGMVGRYTANMIRKTLR